jgi:hypothetical protein
MGGHRTFPKEGIKELKQAIRDLKSEIKQKDKQIKFLEAELENIVKPARERKPHKTGPDERSYDERRQDFMKRFRRDVLEK